jgi:polyvinyl alcohol dehydrogenase (cytochrome)
MSAVALLPLSVHAQNLGPVPTQTITQDLSDWPMYNHDLAGTRFNPMETKLSPQSVSQGLIVKYSFPTKGDVYATPSVVHDIVYAGDAEVVTNGPPKGNFYALTSTLQVLWQQSGFGPITASALVTNGTNGNDGMVIFGDQTGFIYALDRETGELLWQVPADQGDMNPTAVIFGSPILVDGQVIIGVSSNEGAGKDTFRGSVISINPSLNPNVRRINWQHYLITDKELQKGSAGAGVWSTPTYDPVLKLVFVTTGNNYTVHTTETSDAFVALEAATGHERWHFQAHPNDKGQIEADIGDSPQVYTLNGKKVVGAGQKKTGIYWVLDASTGALVNKIQAVPNCKDSLGLFADSAIMGDVVFANGVNCKLQPATPPAGEVVALKNDASGKLWEFPSAPRIDSVLSGVAVANGVVYFHTSGFSSVLYALDATTGQCLASVPTSGGISGPSVSKGQIYVGTGTIFASHFPNDSFILAIGLSP